MTIKDLRAFAEATAKLLDEEKPLDPGGD